MTNTEKYKEALELAKSLPTHIAGKLQPIYQFATGVEHKYQACLSSEDCSPAEVFEAMRFNRRGSDYYYIRQIPTFREDGKGLKKAKHWKKVLFFHKKWARTDIPVKDVEFDIVGLKRESAKLPAGVLIDNIKFITE